MAKGKVVSPQARLVVLGPLGCAQLMPYQLIEKLCNTEVWENIVSSDEVSI